MGAEPPTVRTPAAGLDSPFGKARSMVFPRSVLAGHGVLSELGRQGRGFDFPARGVVVTGPKTAELAGNRAAEILRHRQGEIAPMAFLKYEETRPWAKAIRAAVLARKMPPCELTQKCP